MVTVNPFRLNNSVWKSFALKAVLSFYRYTADFMHSRSIKSQKLRRNLGGGDISLHFRQHIKTSREKNKRISTWILIWQNCGCSPKMGHSKCNDLRYILYSFSSENFQLQPSLRSHFDFRCMRLHRSLRQIRHAFSIPSPQDLFSDLSGLFYADRFCVFEAHRKSVPFESQRIYPIYYPLENFFNKLLYRRRRLSKTGRQFSCYY